VVTDLEGKIQSAAGISQQAEKVALNGVAGRDLKFSVEPNATIDLGRISSQAQP